jgi:uncharacterized RDD family membrane protein YckC
LTEIEPAAGRRAGYGVYYSRDNYAGFWRRLAVDLVDFLFLFVGVVIIMIGAAIILPGGGQTMVNAIFWSSIVLGFVYLVPFKRSPLCTLGYTLGGVRIVNLQGDRPSLWALTIRALFVFIGPLNMLLDIVWVTGDEHRQALRDKWAHTYVIRKRAVPLGQGTVTWKRYTILGMNFLFQEIRVDGPTLPNPLQPTEQKMSCR